MTITEKFQKAFPDCWFKEGFEWSEGAVVWSGEGSQVGEDAAFNYNSWEFDPSEKIWQMGIHVELVAFAEKFNCHWEANDPGTYILYKD